MMKMENKKKSDQERFSQIKEFLLLFDIKRIELYEDDLSVSLTFDEIEKIREEFRSFAIDLKELKEKRNVFDEIIINNEMKRKAEIERLQREKENQNNYLQILRHSISESNEVKECETREKEILQLKYNELIKRNEELANHNRQLTNYIENYRKMNQLLEEKLEMCEENGKNSGK